MFPRHSFFLPPLCPWHLVPYICLAFLLIAIAYVSLSTTRMGAIHSIYLLSNSYVQSIMLDKVENKIVPHSAEKHVKQTHKYMYKYTCYE